MNDQKPQPTSLDEAKALYRKLARENHPDLGGSPEAMKAINNAFDAILPLLEKQEPVKTIEELEAEAEAMDDATLSLRLREAGTDGVAFSKMTPAQRVLVNENMKRQFRSDGIRPLGKSHPKPLTPAEEAALAAELYAGNEQLEKLNEELKRHIR